MPELTSPLSPALDSSAKVYAARQQEVRAALSGLLHLAALATRASAVAVALVDGDVERSVATWLVPAYAIDKRSGISRLLVNSEATLALTGANVREAGVALPVNIEESWTLCAKHVRSRRTDQAGIMWLVRPTAALSPNELELFEHSVALVGRELNFLARHEDIAFLRERATVEVAQLHDQLNAQHGLYRALAKHLPGTTVLVFDSDLHVRLREGRMPGAGMPTDVADGSARHVTQYFPVDLASRIAQACREALDGRQAAIEAQVQDRTLELSIGPLQDAQETIALGLIVTRDITEARRKQEQTTAFGTRLHALVQNLDDGILVEDENRRVQLCSNRLCDIMRLDVPSDIHIGCDGRELTAKMASICFIPEAFEESTSQLVDGGTAQRRELIYLADMRIIERDYSPLAMLDRPMGHLWVYRDVTQREQSKDLLQRQTDQLRALSLVDELTGLYNRRGFLTLATQQLKLCDRTMRPALVVFVDLDGMKRINDDLGHEFGDQALTETANTMRQCFRYSDVLARLGGDEFVALAIDAAEDTADTIRDRLYERLSELNSKPGRPFELQFSVGMAPYDPTRAEMIEEVLARADSLMYEQKRARKAARR